MISLILSYCDNFLPFGIRVLPLVLTRKLSSVSLRLLLKCLLALFMIMLRVASFMSTHVRFKSVCFHLPLHSGYTNRSILGNITSIRPRNYRSYLHQLEQLVTGSACVREASYLALRQRLSLELVRREHICQR